MSAPTPAAPTRHGRPPRTSSQPIDVRRHRRRRTRGGAASVAALAATAALLSGCAGPVALEPAADATAPACADVIVRLPDAVADAPRRETDAQATGAWGDPASVLLSCGVEPYGPTTLPCDNVNGIDWIRDDSDAPTYVFTTYGRTPAVQVVVDSEAVSGTSALVDLEAAVASIPQTEACLNADDVLGTPSPVPTPTP